MGHDLGPSVESADWWCQVFEAFAVEKSLERRRRLILRSTTSIPLDLCRVLVSGELTWSRQYRRCLRSTFGFDPLTRQVINPEKAPKNPEQSRRMWRLVSQFERAYGLFQLMNRAYHRDVSNGGTGLEAAIRQYVISDRTVVWMAGRDTVLHPDPLARDEASAKYVGTLLARVNLDVNLRVCSSHPGMTTQERFNDLVGRFPGAAMEALHNGSANDSPQTVLNRALRYLEWEDDPTRQHHTKERRFERDGPPEPWPVRIEYDPMPLAIRMLEAGTPPEILDIVLQDAGYGTLESLIAKLNPESHAKKWQPITGFEWPPKPNVVEDFSAREEAKSMFDPGSFDIDAFEAAWSLAERAGLAPRQAEVFALASGGMTHSQISKQLGISVGTSKPTLMRAIEKIRAAFPGAG